MHFGEDAAAGQRDARVGYATMREAANAKPSRIEGGTMDRNAVIKPADAWGKPLTEGYAEISPGVVQKEFGIVLKDGELLNEIMHSLIVKAEQIPSALPLFWREQGPINGCPQVLVQGHPHRVARFEELLNERDRLQRDGWLVWENHDERREVSRIRWIRPVQHPSPGPCQAYGCGVDKSPRWALVYLVGEIGHEKPQTGVVVVYCQDCAVPKGTEFIEEEK